ncbi:MAG: hypothetical protein KDD04_07675 [Sinomicrobium sp.]|nr:hypothetical protein [Sinomicrobium sp.]
MKVNQILRQQFLDTVENQLQIGDPPETAQTLNRLKSEGFSDQEAKDLISACVAAEIFSVLDSNLPFNRERYISWLSRLPELPE